jgi:DNA-binding LacI/PurR family transcriptional regulator
MPRLDRSRRTNVTIYDIAEKLNISASTVSRALRNHPDIKPETVAAIKDMAKKLHYLPNVRAQSLRGQNTRTIGVILPEIQQFFYGTVLNGIEDVAFRKGYQLLVCKSAETYDRELLQVSALSNQVDGVIACLSQQTRKIDHFKQLKQQGLPLVFFDRAPERIAAHRVVFDNEASSFLLTEHLLKSGFKRIAHLTGPDHLSLCQERTKGYKKALQQYGIPFEPGLVLPLGFGYQEGRSGFIKLMELPMPPDAIFAGSDQIATAVVIEARRIGIDIPQQLGLVAFGSDPVHALLDPAVTGLNPKGYEMGSRAAQVCIQEIENPDRPGKSLLEQLTAEIVIRRSSVKPISEENMIASYSRYVKRDALGNDIIYQY